MVSVLVPVFNAEKFLNRCVDSILTQTNMEFELILANDGSKDNSLALCEKYAQQDKRVKVISHENIGVAATREGLLAEAIGEFFLYVDSDDWIEPNMLERMMEQADGVDIVFCSSDSAETPEHVRRHDFVQTEIWNHDKQIMEFLKHKRMTGMLWNKLIRRSTAKNAHFNPKTGYGEDAEFLWQVLQNTDKMLVTNEILYHHVLEDASISHLSYSEKKYSAIPMWERINEDVARDYTKLVPLARTSITSAAVFGLYEARQCGYKNKRQLSHMREITRKNILTFLGAEYISVKFKLYALAVCLGV